LPGYRAALRLLGRCGSYLHGCAEAPRRTPDPEPALGQPPGPADRGIRASADDERDRDARRGYDLRRVQGDVLAVEGERLAREQPAQHHQALVHPPAARGRIDAADLDLVAV